MNEAEKIREMTRILAEVEDLLPDLLAAISDARRPTAEESAKLRSRYLALVERSRAILHARDCLPAAERGRAKG